MTKEFIISEIKRLTYRKNKCLDHMMRIVCYTTSYYERLFNELSDEVEEIDIRLGMLRRNLATMD